MVVDQPITDPISGPSFYFTFTFGPELDNKSIVDRVQSKSLHFHFFSEKTKDGFKRIRKLKRKKSFIYQNLYKKDEKTKSRD